MRAMTDLAFATVEVRCRWREIDVTVRMLTDDGWHPVEILSCSAFADATDLACGTPCLAEAAACHQRGVPLAPRPDRMHG